jgi:hypothetical protein
MKNGILVRIPISKFRELKKRQRNSELEKICPMLEFRSFLDRILTDDGILEGISL